MSFITSLVLLDFVERISDQLMSLLAFANWIGLAVVHWVTQKKKKQIGERAPLSFSTASAVDRETASVGFPSLMQKTP